MRKIMLLVAAMVMFLCMACQEKKQDEIADKDLPQSLLRFIPEHYTLMDTARGDLNQDGIQDLMIILSHVNDSLSDSENPMERPLLLLLGQKDNTYKEIYHQPKAVYCSACGGMLGDPYQKLSVREGSFTLEHFGGSSWKWARTTTFHYVPSKKDWYLHEDAFVSYHGGDPDNIETRILTKNDFGELSFSEFDIYKQ